MKKIMKLPILLLFIMLSFSIGFFMLFKSSESDIDSAYADVTGVSGEVIYFTGTQGYQPYNYFVDDNGNSTLVAADGTVSTSYYNESGEICSKYYVISGNSSLFETARSSGRVTLILTNEMKKLAEKGILYVQASAGVVSQGDDLNDKIKITVTSGQAEANATSNYVQTSGTPNPEWIKTDFIRVSENEKIQFNFEALDNGGGTNYSKFKIFEPKLIFKIVVDQTRFESDTSVVYPGQILTLSATNDVLDQTGDSDYLKYYRSLFKITYKITEGAKYASISGGKLLVKSNAADDAEITVSAYNRQDSISGGTTTPKTITFKVNAKKYEVKIKSDFEDPATFVGNGSFYEGQKITLKATPKEGYVFKNWIVNGVSYNTLSVNYKVLTNNDISIEFVKNTKVLSVAGVTKVYDGNANVECEIILDGIDANHDVRLSGITARYVNADAGENKKLILEGSPELVGADKNLYELTTVSIPDGYGTILKRDITVIANDMTKVYGNRDEKISYQVSEDYVLNGDLSREDGEDVGVYSTQLGQFEAANPNFNITFIPSQFKIEPRALNIEFDAIEKTYDQTNAVTFTYNITNRAFDDEIYIDAIAAFASPNAGRQKVNFTKVSILGEKASNYTLTEINNVYGNILQKDIVVAAQAKQQVFGESEEELTFAVSGMLEGDALSGGLSREQGQDVGTYKILLSTLGNPNYKINFITANYQILQRELRVFANQTEKTYADSDPVLTYSVENLVEGTSLSGVLERATGENVGSYQINIGTLNNPNYNIIFTPNEFNIIKREATVEIEVLNKNYDGNDEAEYNYTIYNLASFDEIVASYVLKFEDENVGQKRVTIESNSYTGENVENYEFLIVGSLSGNINKKTVNIIVENAQKVYGQQDPEIIYSFDGIVDNDVINASFDREIGEEVGNYDITFISCDNDNYNIAYNQIATFTIIPKVLNIKAVDCSKTFGDEDPTFEYVVSEPLEFNDTLSEVISGQLTRENGNNPAKYEILIGSLCSSSNYEINFTAGYLTVTKRNITVRAIAAEKVYGEEDPAFEYIAENTVEGNNVVLNLRREYGENVGQYTISYSSLNDPRYNIDFVCATLSISPRSVKVKADTKYKSYGDSDPEFTVSVVEGELQFNDDPADISVGTMAREAGENVGQYTISRGTYSLGTNYEITFEEGKLEILKVEIKIKADKITKKYGNQDGELTFVITKGSLKFNDQVQGSLVREEGEEIGSYAISQGTLSINDNYDFTFIPSEFVIEKRQIEIYANAVEKVYGEEDPELTYIVIGGMVDGDVFDGELTREKPQYDQNPELCEYAGKYLITSTLSNENYEITYISNYLTIKQREIFITADSKTKYYGEEDPELTYKITAGEILDDVEIQGNIYRIAGDNAGKYDIRSNLTLGRNYKIVFTKGVFEIKQLLVKVRTYDYEKTYGESNPTFEYEIIEGQLLNGDKLLGGVSKEEGENVGKYRLVSAFNNTNYNVELTENYLTIKPKDAYLNVSIQDKVYNGDTVAYIRQISATGLIDDDIIISYDKENCARFTSSEVGNNIPVTLYDITLSGDKAGNYILHLPDAVYGNITNSQLATEDEKVKIETTTNTEFTMGSTLKSDKAVDTEKYQNVSKEVVYACNVWVEGGATSTQLKDSITVKFELPSSFKNRSNFYVYGTNKNGEIVLLNSKVDGDYIEIETDCLGTFVILSDNEQWINISVYVSAGLLAALTVWFVVYEIQKRSKNGKKEQNKKA